MSSGIKVGELFMALGFDVDEGKLKTVDESLKGIFNKFLSIAGVAGTAVYGINKFMSVLDNATALQNFNTQTGQSIEYLQKWQNAATRMNTALSKDQVLSSFYAINDYLTHLQDRPGGAGALFRLGITQQDIAAGVEGVVEGFRREYEKNVSRWGMQRTHMLMKDVGFDPNMLQGLKATNAEFERMAGYGNNLTQQQIENLSLLDKVITNLKLDWDAFLQGLAADWALPIIQGISKALPYLNELKLSIEAVVDWVRQFLDQHPVLVSILGLIGERFAQVAGVIIAVFNPVLTLLAAVSAAIVDIGNALRGKPSYLKDAWDWLKTQFGGNGSDKGSQDEEILPNTDGGIHLNIKRNDRGELEEILPPEMSDDFKNDWLARRAQSQMERQSSFLNQSPTVNQSNVYNIHSTAPAKDVAREVDQLQQRSVNRAFNSLNNGARY